MFYMIEMRAFLFSFCFSWSAVVHNYPILIILVRVYHLKRAYIKSLQLHVTCILPSFSYRCAILSNSPLSPYDRVYLIILWYSLPEHPSIHTLLWTGYLFVWKETQLGLLCEMDCFFQDICFLNTRWNAVKSEIAKMSRQCKPSLLKCRLTMWIQCVKALLFAQSLDVNNLLRR